MKIDSPLLPNHLIRALNPVCVQIDDIEDLPSRPLPFATLDRKCVPLWGIIRIPGSAQKVQIAKLLQLMFTFLQKFTSKLSKRAADDPVGARLIELTGRSGIADFMQAIDGNNLTIEIHDRSRIVPTPQQTASVFGTGGPEDITKINLPGDWVYIAYPHHMTRSSQANQVQCFL